MTRRGLSKSRIMSGLQCPKLLWLSVHQPELIEYGPATQRIFATGHKVGALAQKLHPGGVLAGPAHDGPLRGDDLRLAEDDTRRLLAGPGDLNIYEATFTAEGVLVRTDLFFREGGRCRFTEVKSSTKLKDEYLQDAAIQTWVLRECGVPVDEVRLAHIDSSFVYAGDGDYQGLLVEEDITADVEPLVPAVPGQVAALRAMLDGDMPDVLVGRQCTSPNECPLRSHCRAERAEYHVGDLPRVGGLLDVLQAAGYFDIRDVPEDMLTAVDHLRVWRATVANEALVDGGLGDFMRTLPYPRFYFDFETISFAVPIWAGTRPYEQLPTQFSCHVERAPGVPLEHQEFLDVSGEPPMRRCAEATIAALGESGPVLVYTPFESRVLRWMADAYPDLAPALNAIIDRIVDLHPPVKAGYYHPDMHGSWSIKAVVPTIDPDLSYDRFDEVGEGTAALSAFEEAIDPHTTSERRAELREKLLRYCEHDTEVMARMVLHFSDEA